MNWSPSERGLQWCLAARCQTCAVPLGAGQATETHQKSLECKCTHFLSKKKDLNFMNSGWLQFQETPPTRHHQIVQNCVLSTLQQKILSPNQLTQMQQEPMSAMKGLQNNWSKGKMTKMTEKNHVSRLFWPSCWSDSKLHKRPIVDLYKSHDWCFITKALTLTRRPEKHDYRLRRLVVFWASWQVWSLD